MKMQADYVFLMFDFNLLFKTNTVFYSANLLSLAISGLINFIG